jgi:hypothetical protein
MSTLPIFFRDSIPFLGGTELLFDSLGAMRCCHVELKSKGHLVVTNWAIHESILSGKRLHHEALQRNGDGFERTSQGAKFE